MSHSMCGVPFRGTGTFRPLSGLSECLAASRRTHASRPNREAKAEGREDRSESIQARITPLRERSVERFAGKPRLARERRHASHRLGYSAKGDGHGARIAIFEHGLNVCGDLSLAPQVIRRSKRAASACGLSSLSSTHKLVQCPAVVPAAIARDIDIYVKLWLN